MYVRNDPVNFVEPTGLYEACVHETTQQNRMRWDKGMKLLTLLLALTSFAPCVAHPQRYRHKSEAEIVRMTPAQRVEEWVNEQVYHRFDLDDDHADTIKRYIYAMVLRRCRA